MWKKGRAKQIEIKPELKKEIGHKSKNKAKGRKKYSEKKTKIRKNIYLVSIYVNECSGYFPLISYLDAVTSWGWYTGLFRKFCPFLPRRFGRIH
jgi:hypothetical protein